MNTLSRITKIEPGYDCKFAPCGHDKKGDHGIAGETWHYVVSDGTSAVNVTILTNRLPETVPAAIRNRVLPAGIYDPYGNMPADVGLHTLFPRYDGHPVTKECAWLESKPCYYDGSGLYASAFWAANGDGKQAEQPESFWLALEAEFRERSASATRDHNAAERQQ